MKILKKNYPQNNAKCTKNKYIFWSNVAPIMCFHPKELTQENQNLKKLTKENQNLKHPTNVQTFKV